MEELGLVGDLAIVAAAAVVGGAVARLLKLPTVIGYLAAGIAIGPHTPGPSGDIDDVQTVADLGVALLMFTLGVRFSLGELREYRGMSLVAGVLVTIGMLGLGTLLGVALGLTTEQAIVAGMVVCISSSMIAIRVLEDSGLIGAPGGRIAIVVSLVQDMLVVVLLVLIPVLAGEGDDLVAEIGLAFLKAGALLAGIWVIGTVVIPPLMVRIAASRSRELFLLSIVALALGTASLSFTAGLSLAFGAFLAGIIISESEYAHRTLVEVLPLREVFAVVFFVAMGMLINPDSIAEEPFLVFGIAGLAVVGKIVLLTASGMLFGFSARTVLPAAVALGNMGEFSFVLASQAVEEGILTAELNEALLASVLLSIAVSPLLFLGHERALAYAQALPGLRLVLQSPAAAAIPDETRLVNHAIIVGYTQAGREVAAALEGRGFRYVIIDDDPMVQRRLKSQGVPAIFGDASVPAVLEMAAIERARVCVVTVVDPAQVESVAATARTLNRRLDVVARGLKEDSHVRLRELGASRVVQSEFEVGMQFVRHTLQRFGLTSQEVQALLLRMRRDRLGEAEPDRP